MDGDSTMNTYRFLLAVHNPVFALMPIKSAIILEHLFSQVFLSNTAYTDVDLLDIVSNEETTEEKVVGNRSRV